MAAGLAAAFGGLLVLPACVPGGTHDIEDRPGEVADVYGPAQPIEDPVVSDDEPDFEGADDDDRISIVYGPAQPVEDPQSDGDGELSDEEDLGETIDDD